jgi:uncharacterized peroxidase-related enzyme
MKSLYIPDIEQNPKPGTYQQLVMKTKAEHPEYPKIWDLFAFGQDFTTFLAKFTQGVLHTRASITPAVRELIAAYTSRLNNCEFCTKAHAVAASEHLENEHVVAQVLADPEAAPITEKEKVLLRFAKKVTHDSSVITAEDMGPLRLAGWDDEAIYYAITTCSLFNFYNRWISAAGVPAMSDDMHRWQGKLIKTGYVRGD